MIEVGYCGGHRLENNRRDTGADSAEKREAFETAILKHDRFLDDAFLRPRSASNWFGEMLVAFKLKPGTHHALV